MHAFLAHVQGYHDGASVVVPLAVVARRVSEVTVLCAVGTTLIPGHQVGGEVNVRKLSVRVEMEVWALQRGIGVRSAVVVGDGVAYGWSVGGLVCWISSRDCDWI